MLGADKSGRNRRNQSLNRSPFIEATKNGLLWMDVALQKQ